ncbi:methyltransferase, TIGR04325 family [Pseudoxanthomonas wuyuanensis]
MQIEGTWPSGYRTKLLHIAREAMELPGLRLFARPLYRRYFHRPYADGNLYYGIFASHAQAQEQAQRFSSGALPCSYDVEAAGRLYRAQLHRLRICDYAAMFWLERALADGARRIFDLGGHIGLAYYAFGRYLDLPEDLDWCVHDVPRVMAAGQQWAQQHDGRGSLRFSADALEADGSDLLISSGALQYLDYSLPELLARLRRPPPGVLFNLTPMHPLESYFTLQNLGIAVCPYRITGIPQMLADMEALGYVLRDRWDLPERQLRIPFEPEYAIDRYYGFYFRRATETNLL